MTGGGTPVVVVVLGTAVVVLLAAVGIGLRARRRAPAPYVETPVPAPPPPPEPYDPQPARPRTASLESEPDLIALRERARRIQALAGDERAAALRAALEEDVARTRAATRAGYARASAMAPLLAQSVHDREEVETAEVPAVAPEEDRRPRVRQVAGFDSSAVAGVMSRDIAVFLRTWRSTTFSAVVEPTAFLLAFGLGFGALVSRVRGIDYIQFVGTGVVATTVVFSSAFPGMFSTFVKSRFQRVYDAILAAPVNVDDIVTAEVLWIAIRTGVYSMAPLGVAIAFGLRPSWGIVAVPFIAFLTGFGFAAFGVTIAAMAKAITNFNYIISGLLTPLLLIAGAYFPVDSLPRGVRIADQLNPLYHCVELVRDAVFHLRPTADLWHVGALLVFAIVMWRLAIWRLRPQLID